MCFSKFDEILPNIIFSLSLNFALTTIFNDIVGRYLKNISKHGFFI